MKRENGKKVVNSMKNKMNRCRKDDNFKILSVLGYQQNSKSKSSLRLPKPNVSQFFFF